MGMYESRHCTFIINSIFPSADLVSEGTLVDISVFLLKERVMFLTAPSHMELLHEVSRAGLPAFVYKCGLRWLPRFGAGP